MSSRTSSIPPKTNTGALTGLPWLQEGYSYGRNDSGPFQTWITEGLHADVDADANNFLTGGWTHTVTRKKGGISSMEAHAGWSGGSAYTTEVLENIWELDPQESEKSLLDADFPNGMQYVLNKKTRSALKIMVTDTGGHWMWNPPYATFIASDGHWYVFTASFATLTDTTDATYLPGDDLDTAYALYLLIMAGVSQFPIDASIIQHTQLVSNRYTLQASFSNVHRIISSVSMTSIEGLPGDLLFTVPASPGQGAAGAPTQFIQTAGDLQYGWKKARPGVTRLALFKWRVVRRWQFGLWPVLLFGNPI